MTDSGEEQGMNDVEKAFAYQNEGLEEKRARADKHLEKLGVIINEATDPSEDSDFIAWFQEILDDYMVNVCKRGRSR